jgi:hypothetical protein
MDRRKTLVNKVQREQTSFFGTTRIYSSKPVVCLVRAEAPAEAQVGDVMPTDDCWEGFVKYSVEMDSLVVTYIPSFVKICSGIQN